MFSSIPTDHRSAGSDRTKSKSKAKIPLWKYLLIGAAALLLVFAVLIIAFIMPLFSKPDLSTIPPYHPFKSPETRIEYLKYYDMRSETWPVACETRMAGTSYGQTFVRICGPAGAPPLVLLPSANATSLIWAPNIKSLSGHFRVYAVDNIYDVGLSVYRYVFKTPDDYTGWLDELFTSLNLGDSINLMGLSYGGWLTSRYALRYPGRLRKIVMAAPAATVLPLPDEWPWRGVLSAMPHPLFMKTFMVDWLFEDFVKTHDKTATDLLINDALMSMKCFKFRMPVAPTVLADREWRSVRTPALFIVGENEKIYPAKAAIARLNKVAPGIETALIPNAGHDLTIVQAEMVDEKVIEFLER